MSEQGAGILESLFFESKIDFIESIPGACLILNSELVIIFDNHNAQILYESNSSLKGIDFRRLVLADTKDISNESIFQQSEHITLSRKTIYVGVKFNPISLNDQHCYVLLINDLSEVKKNQLKIADLISETHTLSEAILKTQTELVRQEKRLHSLVHSQLNFLIRTDTKGQITFANNSFKKLFEIDDSELETINIKDIIAEKDTPVWETVLNGCQKNLNKSIVSIFKMVLPDQQVVHIEWEIYSLITEEDGEEKIEIQAVGNNITDKKKTELELQKALTIFTSVFNQSSDALFLVNTNNAKIIDCNNKAVELFEFDEKEGFIGKKGYDYEVKSEDHIPLDTLMKASEKGNVYREVKYKTNKANYFWGDFAAKTIPILEEKIMFVRVTNITDKKEKESKINGLLEETLLVNQELKSKNHALNKANRELDNFVYRVSHDLRAPIASTLGLIDLAKIETDKEKADEYLQYIRQSMHKLDDLIRDILDYSKNNRMEVQRENVALQQLTESVISQYQFLIEDKGIRVINDISEKASIYTDVRRFTVILNNLISNAIRYSNPYKEDKYIKIEYDCDEREHIIAVSDNGIGIPNKYQSDIFKMFFRIDNRGVSGSGIGLYIVKESLDKLNGKINVYSIEGKGTTFTVSLPMLQA